MESSICSRSRAFLPSVRNNKESDMVKSRMFFYMRDFLCAGSSCRGGCFVHIGSVSRKETIPTFRAGTVFMEYRMDV